MTSTSVNSKKVSHLAFFDHLPRKVISKSDDLIEGDRILHPATIKLGGLYSKGIVQTDDDRVLALIGAFCSIIRDYQTPPKKILREDMDKHMSKQVIFVLILNSPSLFACLLMLLPLSNPSQTTYDNRSNIWWIADR